MIAIDAHDASHALEVGQALHEEQAWGILCTRAAGRRSVAPAGSLLVGGGRAPVDRRWPGLPFAGARPGEYGRAMGSEQEPPEPQTAPGNLVGRSIDEFVGQLRGFTDRARSLAGSVPGRLHLPALPSPPGAMSAAQVGAVAQMVKAQRDSIAAMRSQLDAFDQQLAVLDKVLDPLVEWSSSWARLEEAVGDFVRPPSNDTGKVPEV